MYTIGQAIAVILVGVVGAIIVLIKDACDYHGGLLSLIKAIRDRRNINL